MREWIAATILIVSSSTASSAEGLLSFLRFPHGDSFALVGVGAGPRYLGATENVWAAAPAAQFEIADRTAMLEANYLTVNLLNDPNWTLGPAGLLRFGRGMSDYASVDSLPNIDWTIELGADLAYQWPGAGYQDQSAAGISLLADVGNVHNGWVSAISYRKWIPIGKYGTLGLGAATTFASGNYTQTYFGVSPENSILSGLPSYSAGSGLRDARLTALFVQPVSRSWAIGGGVIFARMLGDAADSPITQRQNLLYSGIGVMRFW